MFLKKFKEFLKEKIIPITVGKKNISIIETNLKSGLSEEDRNYLIDQLVLSTKGLPDQFKQFRFLSFPDGTTYISGASILHTQIKSNYSIKPNFSQGLVFPGVLNKDFSFDITISPENIDVDLIIKKFGTKEKLLNYWIETFGFLKCFTRNNINNLKEIFKESIEENIPRLPD